MLGNVLAALFRLEKIQPAPADVWLACWASMGDVEAHNDDRFRCVAELSSPMCCYVLRDDSPATIKALLAAAWQDYEWTLEGWEEDHSGEPIPTPDWSELGASMPTNRCWWSEALECRVDIVKRPVVEARGITIVKEL